MELRNSLPMSRDLFGTWKNLVLNEQILINRIAKIVTIEANLGNNVTIIIYHIRAVPVENLT